jgi:hypothetical protein
LLNTAGTTLASAMVKPAAERCRSR